MIDINTVKDFWERHVNNEYYTHAQRASSRYFSDIEAKRYRHHYHLVELFERLRATRLTGKNLLEIGCGIGIDTLTLASLGFQEVVGIDLSETAIGIARDQAKTKNIANIRFEKANAEGLSFGDGCFDFVYSFGVIHHTPSIRNAIAEIHRVLKPGGRAIVMIYHRRSLVNLVHTLLRLPYESPRNLKDHCPVVNRYTRREAQELFAGFAEAHIHADYPFTYGMRHFTFFWPTAAKRILGRFIGWHLMIDARKAI
jgi:ubiquinone/menaquinone biosynthesis C-methylase UbiE